MKNGYQNRRCGGGRYDCGAERSTDNGLEVGGAGGDSTGEDKQVGNRRAGVNSGLSHGGFRCCRRRGEDGRDSMQTESEGAIRDAGRKSSRKPSTHFVRRGSMGYRRGRRPGRYD
jgi:hypothetical protein